MGLSNFIRLPVQVNGNQICRAENLLSVPTGVEGYILYHIKGKNAIQIGFAQSHLILRIYLVLRVFAAAPERFQTAPAGPGGQN